jgi:ATP synthase protein I
MNHRDPEMPSLEEFEKKLQKTKSESEQKLGSTANMGLRLGAEFASGVLVGVGIGLLLDRWLDTRPWLMILCLCFGTAAGVKTMMGTIRQFERQNEKDAA